MTRIYRYEIIFKSYQVDSLLYDFKNVLIRKSAAKLTQNKKWKPEATYVIEDKMIQLGIKGMRDDYSDHKNSYCFSLAFPKEQSFVAVAKELDFNNEGIGCVWTGLTVGKRWGILELIAATTSISMLFTSEFLQQEMIRNFKRVGEVIILNMDSEGSELLYPLKRSWESSRFDDDYILENLNYHFDVDSYSEDLMRRIEKM